MKPNVHHDSTHFASFQSVQENDPAPMLTIFLVLEQKILERES